MLATALAFVKPGSTHNDLTRWSSDVDKYPDLPGEKIKDKDELEGRNRDHKSLDRCLVLMADRVEIGEGGGANGFKSFVG